MTQARADLADLVNRVAYSGERIMLTRHGKPLAALVPVADLDSLERRGDIGFELPAARGPLGDESPRPPEARPGIGPGTGSETGPETRPVGDPLRIAARYQPPESPHPPVPPEL